MLVSAMPFRIAVDFIKQGGKKLVTELEIETLLNTLEEADMVSIKLKKLEKIEATSAKVAEATEITLNETSKIVIKRKEALTATKLIK